MTKFLRVVPFIAVIFLEVIAAASKFYMPAIKPFIFIVMGILVVNLLVSKVLNKMSYFTVGISSVAIIGMIFALLSPTIGNFYLENIIQGLYLGLFIVAFFPPLFKLDPFTFEFSKGNYSEVISRGEQFLNINLIINYMWAFLFALCIYLATALKSDVILATAVPWAVQLLIGLPLTIILQPFLMGRISGARLHFNNIDELFNAMPLGLNKRNSKGLDIIVQFYLTGDEPTKGFFIIKNQKCTYTQGVSSEATTTINCDSTLWLGISNADIAGDKALINEEYSVDGDASIMLDFDSYFSSEKPAKKLKTKKAKETEFAYKSFEPGKIKNIIVFDGGPRKKEFSKTTLMVDSFIKGAEEAGASVENIKLVDYNIKPCTGCYTCWTKTPGKCIYSDDMPELLKKYRDADLVVFSSPLYIFNVTGIMKVFMDRLLPLMKPYMLIDENGQTAHPDRYPEKGEQGFVVFSAAGFPDVEHNFDGLIGMYRCWDSHSENMYLMGEFYLASAEMLAQPVYRNRKNEVLALCRNAGSQVVEKGSIDTEIMADIQKPLVSSEVFQSQADNFWESMKGKKSFLTSIPKL